MTMEHAAQLTDTQSADLQEVRSLDAIERDLASLDGRRLDQETAELDRARYLTWDKLSGVHEGGDAWCGILDESEEALDREEQSAIDRLEEMRRQVLRDRAQLKGLPFRPNLPAVQVAAAEAKAASMATRLPGMTAEQVAREIKGATVFGDAVGMAAWAMLVHDLETRFPPTTRITNASGQLSSAMSLFGPLLRQCEAATGNRKAIAVQDEIERQLVRLNQKISEVASARSAHNPTGNVGGILLNYQFGKQGGAATAHEQRRYDPDAVRTRLGRAK